MHGVDAIWNPFTSLIDLISWQYGAFSFNGQVFATRSQPASSHSWTACAASPCFYRVRSTFAFTGREHLLMQVRMKLNVEKIQVHEDVLKKYKAKHALSLIFVIAWYFLFAGFWMLSKTQWLWTVGFGAADFPTHMAGIPLYNKRTWGSYFGLEKRWRAQIGIVETSGLWTFSPRLVMWI